MTGDRPFLGVLLMLAFCMLAPLGDGGAKLLGQTVSLGEILVFRFAMQAVLLAPIVWLTGRTFRAPRDVLGLIALRTVLHVVGIGAMFASYRFLPLADALAIAFVMPFILLFLGKYALGETVGPRRVWAAAVGFAGALMVVQPSFAAVGPPALLPLGVAVVFALFMLVTRQLSRRVEPVALQAISGLMATPVLALALILLSGVWDEAAFRAPTAREWPILLGIGVLGVVAHLCMTWALRFAPSATLAPMQYIEIPVATLVGWAMFGDLPNGLAAAGIVVTMAAGLYVIWRERLAMRAAPPPD